MIDLLSVVAVSLYAGVLALLLPFAAHRMVLLIQSRKRGGEGEAGVQNTHFTQNTHFSAARVTVQLPVFNEKHVVERLIDAACRLRHPAANLQVQVLDDSTDETTALAKRRADTWRGRGVNVRVIHRTDRTGYKAGALAAGLEAATGEFVLILDADFVPSPGLLESLLPVMQDPGVGMVQARWDHLNERESWLTRAQALLLDGHFFVEQKGRYLGGRFFNFNGTAGPREASRRRARSSPRCCGDPSAPASSSRPCCICAATWPTRSPSSSRCSSFLLRWPGAPSGPTGSGGSIWRCSRARRDPSSSST